MTDRWTDAGRMDGGKNNVLVHPYHEGKFVYVEVLSTQCGHIECGQFT